MDDLAAFLRARYDEIDPKDFHDRYQCDLGTLQFFGDCSCKVPELVRRDIEAKRRILDEYTRLTRDFTHADETVTEYTRRSTLEDVLQWLAEPYAAHPDYRPEWRPDLG